MTFSWSGIYYLNHHYFPFIKNRLEVNFQPISDHFDLLGKRSFGGSTCKQWEAFDTLRFVVWEASRTSNAHICQRMLKHISSSILIDTKVKRRSPEVTKALHIRKDSSFLN